MAVTCISHAWEEDYLYWQQTDKKVLRKIKALIKEISSTPFDETGKPEPLKENLAGWWSRRINLEHRLIYRVEEGEVVLLQCRYHY